MQIGTTLSGHHSLRICTRFFVSNRYNGCVVSSNFGTALEARQALALQGTSPDSEAAIETTAEPLASQSATTSTAVLSEESTGSSRRVTGNVNAKGKAALVEKLPGSQVITAPGYIPGEKSEYEKERERNIARNKLLLEELGLNKKWLLEHKGKARPVQKTSNVNQDPNTCDTEDRQLDSEHSTSDAASQTFVIYFNFLSGFLTDECIA